MMHRINIEEIRANQQIDIQGQKLAKQSKELNDFTAMLAQQTSKDARR